MPAAIYALLAVNFALGTQTFVFAGLLAELARDLGVPVGTAGLAITAGSVTFALSAPVLAFVLARMERRIVLLAGVTVLLLGNLACMVAPNFWTLVSLRVVTGFGAGLIGAVSGATAAEIAPPDRRGRALALVLGGLTLAFMLGLPLGSAAGGAFGWRACFALAAAVASLAIVALLALMHGVQPGTRLIPNPSKLLRIPTVRPAFATTFLSFTALFCVVAFAGPLVNQVTGLTGAGVGPFQACIGLGSIAGLYLGGQAADRGRRAVLPLAVLTISVCELAYAALLAGWGGAFAVPALAATIFVSAAGLFTTVPVIQARLASIAGTATPRALALNSSLISLKQGSGAAIGGMVRDATSFAAAGIVVAIIALGIALLSRTVFSVEPHRVSNS